MSRQHKGLHDGSGPVDRVVDSVGLVHNRVWAVSYLDQRAECQPFRRLMTNCRSPHPRTKPCALQINTEPHHQFQVSTVNVQERVFVVRRWGLLSALNPNSSKHLAEPA